MTTIHGDPDLFTSRTSKLPGPYDFEKRSIRCGVYPEQVEYTIQPNNQTLEGVYYITVYGYVQSTFSLVYFSHTDSDIDGPLVKLSLGLRQKGVIKSTNETMLYMFKLSNEVREDVEVRLQAENGQFVMLHAIDYRPSLKNYTSRGSDRQAIRIKQTQSLTKNIQAHYVRVIPV